MEDGQSTPMGTERRSESEQSSRLSDDELYRALAARPRRRLLYVLLDEGESTIREIAAVLAGWDATLRETMVTTGDRDRILVKPDHVHLPKLVRTGLVTYDRESGAVEIEQLDGAVVDLICRSVESERPASPDDA